MSYCLNPACSNPENPQDVSVCQACGSSLLLRDRYRIVRALAQGGFGATFLAQQVALPGEPYCVIKQLRPTSNAPHVLQMARILFEREAKTLGKIGNHPQIPSLIDYFEANEEFYLVQEFIDGLTLQQEVKQGGPFTEAGVKQFLSEILPLLQYLHSSQVIHRDIKPANLIRRTMDAKLVMIDFGAVKDQISPNFASTSENTALTSFAIGTPGYAPPEQMSMRPVYASDLYALGVTCVYLLSAKAPKDMDYDPATGDLMWHKYIDVSDHFLRVLQKMLEVSVKHRYQSANEILRDLDLEPYIDSLAKGMATSSNRTPPKSQRFDPYAKTFETPKSPSRTSSHIASVAARIRARRAAADSSTGGGTRAGTPSGRLSPTRAPSPANNQSENTVGLMKPRPPKLDANGVLSAYAKGTRDFASHDFSLLNLPKANLSGAKFTQGKFIKVNLQDANLSNADFTRATLTGANLRNAKLIRALCTNSNFEGADLRGADFSNAQLTSANLKGANLCGANLSGAKVTDEQLASAKTNWSTTRPDGKRGLW